MISIPKKLAERIDKSAYEFKDSYISNGQHWEAVVAESAFKSGCSLAATEILREAEKLIDALVKANCDCSNYADCDRCSALLSWSNFIGQNVVGGNGQS